MKISTTIILLPLSFLLIHTTQAETGPLSTLFTMFNNFTQHPHIITLRTLLEKLRGKAGEHLKCLKEKTDQLKNHTKNKINDTYNKMKGKYQEYKQKNEIVTEENDQDMLSEQKQLQELLEKLTQSFAEHEKQLKEEMEEEEKEEVKEQKQEL
ncbi:hypothetical protein M153_2200027139 [Pseudoloma neurophilia]|uniref:Uncharacterized protein n=1 Tax=Pseudoloma neurophilia TaxID=146866 RepID=A0A0R0M6Y5_9MICR|nr:hypothetical protein M153_2200027139 [Pseudoloma neurophilia]